MKHHQLISACALIAATAGFAAPAMAVPLSSPASFEISEYVGTGGPIFQDFGSITLTTNGANSTDVLVTLSPNIGFVPTGKTPDVLDFYLPGVSSISVTFTDPTTGFTVDNTSGSSYGTGATGSFNFAIDCPTGGACGTGGNNPNPGPLEFTINVPITDFSANGSGFWFLTDICDGIGDAGCNGTPGITGPAVATDPPPTTDVPEPLTLSLFGAGLAGAVAMRRRKKQTA